MQTKGFGYAKKGLGFRVTHGQVSLEEAREKYAALGEALAAPEWV